MRIPDGGEEYYCILFELVWRTWLTIPSRIVMSGHLWVADMKINC
jgi:hypothetical protein